MAAPAPATAGQLQHRITLQRRKRIRDGFGHWIDAWDVVHSTRAKITPIGGRERMRSHLDAVLLTHTVTIRYHPDVPPALDAVALRVAYQRYGQPLRILSVVCVRDVGERSEWLVLDCIEGGERDSRSAAVAAAAGGAHGQ